MFDCLRKVNGSFSFRAHALLTLSVILEEEYCISSTATVAAVNTITTNVIAQQQNADEEAVHMLEKTLLAIESHLSNITIVVASTSSTYSVSEEFELFQVCMLRLLNVSSAVSLTLLRNNSDGSSSSSTCMQQQDNQRQHIENLHDRISSIRYQQLESCSSSSYSLSSSSSKAVKDESLNYFRYIIPIDSNHRYSMYLLEWFATVIKRRFEYSFDAINTALHSIAALLHKYPVEACKV